MPIFAGPFAAPGDDGVGFYRSQLAKLLPPGALWDLESDSTLIKLLTGMGDELERLQQRGLTLIDESDPRSASETLEEWEKALGLPDERVTSISTDTYKRRTTITQKYVGRGGQNYEYFASLCAACGYPLQSIFKHQSQMLRVGARVNDRVYGKSYAYTITITLNAPTEGALSHADFERVIRHITHSHITVIFVYL